MPENIVFFGDWSNLSRGQKDMKYKRGQYSKEAGFRKMEQWLSQLGHVSWKLIYTPMHDVYGHYLFLKERGYRSILCPATYFGEDTTDAIIIEDLKNLIANYRMNIICLGSGDGGFHDVLQLAKNRGIKVAIVYGSEISLSSELRIMADIDPITCEPMLYHFDPTN